MSYTVKDQPFMAFVGQIAEGDQYLIRTPSGHCQVVLLMRDNDAHAVEHRDALASRWECEVPFLALSQVQVR